MVDLYNKRLNFVYDDWPDGQEFPNPNRPKNYTMEMKQHDNNSPWMPSYTTMRAFPNIEIHHHKINIVSDYPDIQFYYHIWHRNPLVYNFFDKGQLPIDESVLIMFNNNKNLHLIFMNETEVEPKHSLEKLNELLIEKQLDSSRVWVINNNQKLSVWKEELNTKINVHSTRILPLMLKYEVPPKFELNKNTETFFMCHNRSPRSHRYGLLCLLKKNGLLTNTNWSLINGWQTDQINKKNKYTSIFSELDMLDLEKEMRYFDSIETVKSRYETHIQNFDVRSNQEIFNHISTYENSYVNLVTETNFEDDAIHISEKSIKPFFYLQFPLILASFQHNYFLKNVYCFDLFEDVIDYSFDKIENSRDRLFAYVEEVKRIHQNKEFFIEFYKNNQHRFMNNHNIVSRYQNHHDHTFFNNLP